MSVQGPESPSSSTVDLGYWASMPGWQTSEQAALMLQLDPDETEGLNNRSDFALLERSLLRYAEMGILDVPTPPREFIEWAESNAFAVPNSLRDAVFRTEVVRNWKKECARLRKRLKRAKSEVDEEITNEAGRKSASMILLAIAEAKFGYKRDGNDGAAGKIAGLIAQTFDHPIQERAVRNWLNLAEQKVGKQRA